MSWPIIYFVHLVFSSIVLLIGRIFYVSLIKKGKIRKGRYQSVETLVVLGSGGHTTEILQIVKNLKTNKYTPRIYVHADSDKISAAKVLEIESENNDFRIIEISRSREVGQSYVTSLLTTLVSFKDSIKILWNLRPDLVLCNGPGTRKMSNIAALTGAHVPWDVIMENLQYNIPIEFKHQLKLMCNKLRSSCEMNKNLHQSQVESSLLRIEACLDQTWEVLNTGYWKNVPIKYRHCYTLCSVVKCVLLEIQYAAGQINDDEYFKRERLIEIIKQIDRAILLGAPLPNASDLMTAMASRLNCVLEQSVKEAKNYEEFPYDSEEISQPLLPGFTWIKRIENPSMETFYRDIFMPKSPALLEKCLGHWKALKSWKNVDYLMKIAGNRTVPIEIGSRYTEEDWSQSLVTFAEFLQTHVSKKKSDKIGYLAQHQLFEQIPEMKEDFTVPDYCNFSDNDDDEASPPDINAWFGPRGTVSSLHFDPKNNLLCQVFGYKRIILYRPEESTNLYPYETRLLSNTAQVDPVNPDFSKWPKLKEANGSMCYLEPGDMLFIPPGWWHHVESLAPSFSISFWWC